MASNTTDLPELEDAPLHPSEILGTETFEDVLYTGETGVVNVLTGETPEDLDRSVEEAKEFAADVGENKVAKASHPEQAVESRSAYSACAFFHFSITGGMDYHKTYRLAWESDDYDVDYEADYETGDLTITVAVAGGD